jgi:hypothetical protein
VTAPRSVIVGFMAAVREPPFGTVAGWAAIASPGRADLDDPCRVGLLASRPGSAGRNGFRAV